MTRNRNTPWIPALVLAVAVMAGCGSNPAAVEDEGFDEGYSTTPQGGISPVAAPVAAVVTPPPAPTPPPPTLIDMTATVVKKSGGFFNYFSCKVEVSNPSSVVRKGTLTVTFVNGDTPEPDSPPVTQKVMLEGSGSETYTFKDDAWYWLEEDAKAEITTDPYTGPGAPAVAATGMGVPGAM